MRDSDISVQNLLTNLYEMARKYLTNCVQTADSFRHASQEATSMGRFVRDVLNRNVYFDNIKRGCKRGWDNGRHYSVPRVGYDGYGGYSNGYGERKRWRWDYSYGLELTYVDKESRGRSRYRRNLSSSSDLYS